MLSATPRLTLGQRLGVVLDSIRFLGKPGHFTTGKLAIDAEGNTCSPISPDATACCGIGAVVRSAHRRGLTPTEWDPKTMTDPGDHRFYEFAELVLGNKENVNEVVQKNDGDGLKAVLGYLGTFVSFFKEKKAA